MSYIVNESDLFIPSKSLEVFPLSRQDIRPNGDGVAQVQFNFQPSLEFIDPRSMRLRYECEFEGRGQPHPSSSCGVNAFWRHQRIQTNNSLTILSETDEFSSLVAMGYSYSANDGENNNRALNEGLVKTTSNRQVLFWEPQNTPTEKIDKACVAKKVQINQKIYSGVFDNQVVPVGVMGGLNLILQTNNVMKSVKTLPCDFENSVLVKTTSAKASWNDADKAKNVVVVVNGGVGLPNNNFFVVGDRVWATDTDEASAFSVGVVVEVGVSGSDVALTINGFNNASTDLQADLTANTTKLFIKSIDRFEGYSTGANVPTTTSALSLAVTEALKKITWTLRDLKVNVEMVNPPKKYVESVMKKVNSSSGYKFNFKHHTLTRSNVQGVNGLLSSNINVGNEGLRAYAVNVMPLKSVDEYNKNNLVADGTDNAVEYQFTLQNRSVPDQRCDLRKYSLNPPKINQLHLQELRKSLISNSVMVRNLQQPQENFVIGRAVSSYGHTSDIRGDVSLRVMYDSNAKVQKTFNFYVCSQRTLIIKQDGLMVVD